MLIFAIFFDSIPQILRVKASTNIIPAQIGGGAA